MARPTLSSRLAEHQLLIGDGAIGTALITRGLGPGACPEAWNRDHPAQVGEIHTTYVEAGADWLGTNSFGGHPLKLAHYGLANRCTELNRRAAELTRAAAGPELLVLGSIGPTGGLLEPYGAVSPAEAEAGFRLQAAALAEGGADALCVETMSDLVEACLAVGAAAATGLPVIATMTFELTPRGYFTIMGVSPTAAAKGLAEAGAVVVGANCSTGPEAMIGLVAEFLSTTTLPLLVQPNAGAPVLRDGEVHYPEDAATFARGAERLLDAGARLVGGCCGTTPAHVRAVAGVVRRRRS